MTNYEAPAKLNLSLHVSPARSDGYHPLDSMVQTIQWCDRLEVEEAEGHDNFEPNIEGNLVEKAVNGLRRLSSVPPLTMRLSKEIPTEAGLGGGSSDAAAAIRAVGDICGLEEQVLRSTAADLGADVPLFLTGGTLRMTGVGDIIESQQPLIGFAVGVVVPDFGLSTAEVYRRWDEMGGPEGQDHPQDALPPALRDGMPMRNDLLPAAVDVEPLLGDYMSDVSASWGIPVAMTGSGSACFGYFATIDEAAGAAEEYGGRGVELRATGVARAEA